MTDHLYSCLEGHLAEDGDTFHLFVEGASRPDYWIHFEATADTTLATLDTFLRYLWLECCGHLSAFAIDGTHYSVQPMDQFDERGMDVTLAEVLDEDTAFTHEYDFGTTTELSIRVVARRDRHSGRGLTEDRSGDPPQLLARNDRPAIPCDVCGGEATVVCSHHSSDEEGWLCEDCKADHGCDREAFLPVVNSPRVGRCGYTG